MSTFNVLRFACKENHNAQQQTKNKKLFVKEQTYHRRYFMNKPLGFQRNSRKK